MSREEEIAKIDAELEKMGVETDTVEDIEDEEQEEQDSDDEVVEEVEKPVEEKEEKSAVKLEIKDQPEGAGWYKAREEARKREEVERELAELKKPKIAKEENYEGYIESEIGATKAELQELKAWKQQQDQERQDKEMRDSAFRELGGYETEAAQAFDDYNAASGYAKQMIAVSLKVANPDLTQQELAEKTANKYAEYAARALNAKKHPGQAIYEMAHEWGYKKAEEKPQIIETKQDNRPTITKIGENKKKSSGMSSAGGNGKAFMTNDALMSMTNAERMKLTPSDWARLEAESA